MQTDNKSHILFHCQATHYERSRNLGQVLHKMPQAMSNSYQTLSENEKLVFLLSGLKSNSTAEWPDIYEAIARWVFAIYQTRKSKYDGMDGMTGT